MKHRKARQDAKKVKIFTKLIRELTTAARIGIPDPAAKAVIAQTAVNAVCALAAVNCVIARAGCDHIVVAVRAIVNPVALRIGKAGAHSIAARCAVH